MAALGFLVMFFGLLAAGMPIFLVLGTCAAVLFYVSGQPMVGVAQNMIDQLNSTTLMALPLFVMAAARKGARGFSASSRAISGPASARRRQHFANSSRS